MSSIAEGIANSTITTSGLTANNTEITNGTTPINMSNQRITGLADPISGSDALNRQSGDSRYYAASTALNNITAPSGSLAMHGYGITGLADPL